MSLVEVSTPGVTEALPTPLDQRIIGGVAVWNALTAEHVLQLNDRIDGSFDELRGDSTREFGACLAYAIGLPVNDEFLLDTLMERNASRQNHGVVSVLANQVAEGSTLWTGSYGQRSFFLSKFEVDVVLSDGTNRPGKVYALLGSGAVARAR